MAGIFGGLWTRSEPATTTPLDDDHLTGSSSSDAKSQRQRQVNVVSVVNIRPVGDKARRCTPVTAKSHQSVVGSDANSEDGDGGGGEGGVAAAWMTSIDRPPGHTSWARLPC